MKKAIISKDDILQTSKELILEDGIHSFGMRQIAAKCKVAVGSIYNYYPSRTELLAEVIDSIWGDILRPYLKKDKFSGYVECLTELYAAISEGNKLYPGFVGAHFQNFANAGKKTGVDTMYRAFDELKKKMVASLKEDPLVRAGVFTEDLTHEIFVNFTFSLLMQVMFENKYDLKALVALIKNCIY